MRDVVRKSGRVAKPFRAGLCVMLGAAAFGIVAPAQGAGAVTGACGSTGVASSSGGTATCTYATTGEDTFVVPAGVTSINVVATGGAGGTASDGGTPGGRGATVSGSLSVASGALYIEVGGVGGDTGGFNGGGSGATGGFGSFLSGGGGGASDVRTVSNSLASRLMVAAGGGGGGIYQEQVNPACPGGSGGDAGQPGSGGGNCGAGTAGGGAAGTAAGGGAGGAGVCSVLSVNATSGTLGQGGTDDINDPIYGRNGNGGGGGGGLYGGGGGGGTCMFGAGAAGGGGGSNLVPAGGTSALTSAPPSVTITYVAPAVACVPGFSSATGSEPCVAAPKGSYVDTPAATSATLCDVGTYQPATGQTSCIAASKGYYVDTMGASDQTACPPGTTTTVTGASACVLVNQAPSFVKGPDQTVSANAAAQTVFPWATAISAGPASESGQRLDFIVTNDNNSLFSAQPSVDVDGTLHYTPALNQTGVATVSVSLRDDGGTDAGGVDTSAVQQFMITVNQAPSFAPDTAPPLTASVGQSYGYPFVATGYPATIAYTLVGAPAWLTIDANGVVGGTPPTGTKTFGYSVKATNAAGFATSGPYTVTVTTPPPPSTKADLSTTLSCPTSAKINVNTTCTLTVSNAGPAVAKNVWVALALPSSLTRVSNSGTGVWWRNVVTWKIASLNANASSAFTITFKARTTGKAVIGAATASTSPDPNWKNNFAVGGVTFTR